MISLEDITDNGVLTINARGEITKADYERVLPEIDALIRKHGKLKFYINLEEIEGIEAGAVWEDLKFDWKHGGDYGKIAIIGDSKWEEWGTKISNPFFGAEAKFFYAEHAGEGWDWVTS